MQEHGTPRPQLMTPAEVLQVKLNIWEIRAKHAKGARRVECEHAVADLRAKLARIGG